MKKKTFGISQNRSNKEYEVRHNQLQETFDRHSSLSSYQWTPFIKSQYAKKPSILTSPSIHYEPKNIFENTFNSNKTWFD